MTSNQSEFDRARKVLVGGVNSAVRAFRAVGGTPRFIDRAEGAYMWDVEGRRYIDYLGSWGPMIAGHSHPKVVAAVQAAALRGLSYGAPNVMELSSLSASARCFRRLSVCGLPVLVPRRPCRRYAWRAALPNVIAL